MLFVLVLTVFADLIVAVVAGLIVASFVFVKKVSDVAARQTDAQPGRRRALERRAEHPGAIGASS
jgi:SulP family sulfate permease